ncbi:MAG: hypothetical protein MJ157_00500 [Clostridia bacterium]|nr:hypothetical protein [Clostridia bacterium]
MYNQTVWRDRVMSGTTVIQEGTPVDQTHLNNLEQGIYENRELEMFQTQHFRYYKRSFDDKIAKPSQYTAGNLASLTAGGNIADSGLNLSITNGILRVTYDNGE